METEATLITGSGSQTGYTRWGDYSSMRVDPSDDCTFLVRERILSGYFELGLVHAHRFL
jgi:hypothetical protein